MTVPFDCQKTALFLAQHGFCHSVRYIKYWFHPDAWIYDIPAIEEMSLKYLYGRQKSIRLSSWNDLMACQNTRFYVDQLKWIYKWCGLGDIEPEISTAKVITSNYQLEYKRLKGCIMLLSIPPWRNFLFCLTEMAQGVSNTFSLPACIWWLAYKKELCSSIVSKYHDDRYELDIKAYFVTPARIS